MIHRNPCVPLIDQHELSNGGYAIVTYALGIYLLNLFIGFLTPKVLGNLECVGWLILEQLKIDFVLFSSLFVRSMEETCSLCDSIM